MGITIIILCPLTLASLCIYSTYLTNINIFNSIINKI